MNVNEYIIRQKTSTLFVKKPTHNINIIIDLIIIILLLVISYMRKIRLRATENQRQNDVLTNRTNHSLEYCDKDRTILEEELYQI